LQKRNKKLITFGILVSLVLGQLSIASAQEAENYFPDVPVDYQFYASIQYFYEQEIIEGYPDGNFKPDQLVNRAEAVKVVLGAADIEIPDEAYAAIDFPDVNNTDWFFPYINEAYARSIVDGYPEGDFRPANSISLAETLKVILETHDIVVPEELEETLIYPDVPSDVWFSSYALYSKEKNLIEVLGDGKLHPEKEITRGELVEILYRIDQVLNNNEEPFNISTNWPAVSFPEHQFETKLPFTWRTLINEEEVVLWRQDTTNDQSSYQVVFPFSASIIFHLDRNEEGFSQNDYIKNLEETYRIDYGSYQKNIMTVAGYTTFELNVNYWQDDYFIFYPDNSILHIYTKRGWSDLTPQLEDEIEKVLENLTYITYNPTEVVEQNPEEFLAEIRELLLIEEQGQNIIDQFNDLITIETDTIGVGTGPIDYFYSETYDITLKYERSSDTMLDMMNGQTSAF
jgi:hypothetical protein